MRDEAYYFAPQRQTKILNEGWAAYWHSKIMTERALKVSEIIDYADHNAGVLATAPGQFNPYKIGIELLRDVEERWDKGRFGREWNECQNFDQRRAWDKRLGLGRKKIFEVRKLYNDVTFIDEFFTTDFCERNKFFSFSLNDRTGNYEIDSREFTKIKHKMLFSLTNFGDPFIFVEDSNHDNRGELLMRHRHEGTDLQIDHARATLNALVRIWRRPVNLLTVVEGSRSSSATTAKSRSRSRSETERFIAAEAAIPRRRGHPQLKDGRPLAFANNQEICMTRKFTLRAFAFAFLLTVAGAFGCDSSGPAGTGVGGRGGASAGRGGAGGGGGASAGRGGAGGGGGGPIAGRGGAGGGGGASAGAGGTGGAAGAAGGSGGAAGAAGRGGSGGAAGTGGGGGASAGRGGAGAAGTAGGGGASGGRGGTGGAPCGNARASAARATAAASATTGRYASFSEAACQQFVASAAWAGAAAPAARAAIPSRAARRPAKWTPSIA